MGCKSCLMGWSFPVLISRDCDGCLDRSRYLSSQEIRLQ